MNKELKPCPLCGSQPIIEYWRSGGLMIMVKCPNPVCDIPLNGYPTGRNLEEVKQAWNRRAENANCPGNI